MLRIAIQSKGRLNEESLSLLQSIGIEVDAPKRKLLSKSQTFPIEALYLRDDDIPHGMTTSRTWWKAVPPPSASWA